MAVGRGSGMPTVPLRMRAASSSASASTASKNAESAVPVRDRYALTRAIGSRSFHSSSSLASR